MNAVVYEILLNLMKTVGWGLIALALSVVGWIVWRRITFNIPVTILRGFGNNGTPAFDKDYLKIYDRMGVLKVDFLKNKKGVLANFDYKYMFHHRKNGAMILFEKVKNQFFPVTFTENGNLQTVDENSKHAFIRVQEKLQDRREGNWFKRHLPEILILGSMVVFIITIVLSLKYYAQVAGENTAVVKQSADTMTSLLKSMGAGGAP